MNIFIYLKEVSYHLPWIFSLLLLFKLMMCLVLFPIFTSFFPVVSDVFLSLFLHRFIQIWIHLIGWISVFVHSFLLLFTATHQHRKGGDANDFFPIWKFDHLMNEYCCSRERIYVRKRVWPLFSFACLKLSLLSIDSFNSKHEGGQVFALTTIILWIDDTP